jgi:acetylornithine deacetylase
MPVLPTLLERIQTLIGLPSVSSPHPAFDTSNRAVIDQLAGWLADLGFQIEIQPLPLQPDKANLIAVLGSGSGGLVLAGHTDTVPWDVGRWSQDPLQMTEVDGQLRGLGIADMKAFFAMVIEAVAGLQATNLQHPLVVLATADEESSMEGAQALTAASLQHARYAVIGEPTGLRPIHAHKGILMESVRVVGRSGHSSNPELGRNAIEGMQRVVDALLRWRDSLQQRYRDARFEVPVPTLNFGHIHGGDNPNRICGACELHLDLRPLPGMSLEELRLEMATRLQDVLREHDFSLELRPLFAGTPAMETSRDSDLVKTVERLTGEESGVVNFGTEGAYLNQLGMQTLILGPGDIEQAHQPDESLRMDRIAPTVTLLRELIERYCVRP